MPEFLVTAVAQVGDFTILTLTSPALESLIYYSSTILHTNVDEITTESSISITVDLLTDKTGVTLYGEWSTTITFDTTTRRRNCLLLQDSGGKVIIGGFNPTPSPTAPPAIAIAFSVSTIINGIINNDVSTIAFDTDTTVSCICSSIRIRR